MQINICMIQLKIFSVCVLDRTCKTPYSELHHEKHAYETILLSLNNAYMVNNMVTV